MASPFSFTDEIKSEYNQLFAQARIRPEYLFQLDAVIRKIFDPQSMARYLAIQAAIGIPPHVVGIIHSLEASQRFTAHLHNGDPLTARTRQVPKNRPPPPDNPPFTWETSAIDALKMHKLDQWNDWSVGGIAFILEQFNGWGYRHFHPQVKSPYLWSFTTIYSSGKYVADGRWSDSAVSKQCGGMALLKRMIETGRIQTQTPASPVDEGDVTVTPFIEEDDGSSLPLTDPPPYPGVFLKLNDAGPDVETVQLRLTALGVPGVGGADGDYGELTEAAVSLFQARGVDESGDPLEIDGVVGPQTWQALFGSSSVANVTPTPPPASGSLLDQVLKVAATQVGVREVPRGSNRGPMVDQFLNSVGAGLLGQPWCMAFVYWCVGQAAQQVGVANPAPRTAGVHRAWQLAPDTPGATVVSADDARRNPLLIKPGMVFFISTGKTTGHCGFVADISGGKLVTIEGNTNDNGSREGIGVFTRTKRRVDTINLGFAAFE